MQFVKEINYICMCVFTDLTILKGTKYTHLLYIVKDHDNSLVQTFNDVLVTKFGRSTSDI